MSEYARRNPVTEIDTDNDGTTRSHVAKLGRKQYMSSDDRMPAFAGLAKSTGGFLAENENGMTLEQAMKAGKMDFRVEFQDKVSIQEKVEDVQITPDGVTKGEKTITTTYPYRGTRAFWEGREDEPVGLGMVKGRYQIVQPVQAGELGQAIMDEGGANVVAAGIYGEPLGTRSYLAFKLPEGLTIGGEDRHDLYLTILNSYDGTSGLTGLLAPIRIRCTNMTTATFGRKVANRFSFKHSGDTTRKIQDAREALGLATEWVAHFKRSAEILLATPMSLTEIEAFVEKMLPTPAKVSTGAGERNWVSKRIALKRVITEAETNAFGRGTAYAAFNGAIEYADFLAPTQSGGAAGELSRYTRILQGGETEKFKLRAADLLGVGK